MKSSTPGSNPAQNQGRGISTRTTAKSDTKSGRPRHANVKPPKAKELTPEEQAKILKAAEEAKAAAEKRALAVGDWEKLIPGMSYRQIRGELKRFKAGRFLGEPTTLLNVAEAVVLDITMETTKMRENLAGQLSHYLNPDKAAGSPNHTL